MKSKEIKQLEKKLEKVESKIKKINKNIKEILVHLIVEHRRKNAQIKL